MMPKVFPVYNVTATLVKIKMMCSIRKDKHTRVIILQAAPSLHKGGVSLQK